MDFLFSDSIYWWLGGLLLWMALVLVCLYLIRWRYFPLAHKYAGWQREAQVIEVATHSALYNLPPAKATVYPFVTIVVPARNQVAHLERLLPCLLEQKYAGRFEVIVSDQLSTDETDELLQRLQVQYRSLRVTHIPQSSRYIELRKLAISLGIKAAHSEWVIVVNPETKPNNDRWLQHFAEHFLPEINFIEAYYNYESNGSQRARRAILERIYAFTNRLEAYEEGIVLGSEMSNYAVRRSWFLEQRGFADSLLLPFGEEALLAFHHVTPECCTMLCSEDTRLTEQLPSAGVLKMRRVMDAEVKRRLRGVSWRTSYRWKCATMLFHLFALSFVAYALLRTLQLIQTATYDLNWIYLDFIALLLFGIFLFLPAYCLRRSLQALGEATYGPYLFFYECFRPWYSLGVSMQRFLHRKEFVRKYLCQAVER